MSDIRLREAVLSVALNIGARKTAGSKAILRQRGNDVLLTKLGKCVKGLVFGFFLGGVVVTGYGGWKG